MAEVITLISKGAPLTREEVDQNFDDLHPPLSAQESRIESSRCLFCYDAPCVQACPTSIDIPKFIRQISTNNFTGSAKTILGSNIMGGTCARACPTEVLCEQKCVLNAGENKPIKIGQLQRVAVDHLMETANSHPFERAPSTGKTVAVVGAGPAGLACAHALACDGHDVVVYEAKSKSGGLNEYGLAAYKMVNDFAAKEVEFILEVGGISIKKGTALGRDVQLSDLQESHDAVFIGVGLARARKLGLDGESLSGVRDALGYIESLRQASDLTSVEHGNDVVVIGGGNTAIDAAVQSKRLGARHVTLAYRRGPEEMGATDFEQDLAATNGVNIIHWSTPVGLSGNGSVQRIKLERTKSVAGKLEMTGETFELETDQVLVAVGQSMIPDTLGGLELDGSKIAVDAKGATSLAGVFAGGDCIRSGEDLTVQAVEDGKVAARAITEYLKEG